MSFFSPSPEAMARERARQKIIARIGIGLLIAGAFAIAILPRSIPLPTRLCVAALDLVVAGVLIFALRQKSSAG